MKMIVMMIVMMILVFDKIFEFEFEFEIIFFIILLYGIGNNKYNIGIIFIYYWIKIKYKYI